MDNSPTLAEKLLVIRDTFGICVFQMFVYGPKGFRDIAFDPIDRSLKLRLYAHAAYSTPITNIGLIRHQIKIAHNHGFIAIICHLLKRPPKENARDIAEICRDLPDGFLFLAEIPALNPGPNTYETPEKIANLIVALGEFGIGPEKCKICIDTSHLHSGRVKISSRADARAWLDAVDPKWIGNIALNDSRSELGGADLHERVGLGKIWPVCVGKTELNLHNEYPTEISGYVEFVAYAKKYNLDIILERSGNLFTADQYEICSLNILYNSIN